MSAANESFTPANPAWKWSSDQVSFVSKSQIGLNMVEYEYVGGCERPDEFSFAQNQAVDLQPPVQQGAMIQSQLDFGQRKRRAVRGCSMAEADVFGDESAHETQTQPGEFQFDTVGAHLFHQRPFKEVRQADAVEPDEGANQRKHRQQCGDAKPAESDAAFPPEAGIETHYGTLAGMVR